MARVTVEDCVDKVPNRFELVLLPPNDISQGLRHSIEKRVGVDQPHTVAAPMLPLDRRPTLGRDDQSSDTVVDVITEEQLLRGMESLTPTEPSANGGGGVGAH